MMRHLRRLACLSIATLLAASAAAASDSEQLDRFFERATLQLATPDARVHRFRVWVASDDMRRARGLMFVQHLDDDQGMLFVYPSAQKIGMWMKNTYIPLDMIFIDAAGKVTQVVENTKPHSLETIASEKPVLAVLELKAGTASRLKIAPGALVMHEAFER